MRLFWPVFDRVWSISYKLLMMLCVPSGGTCMPGSDSVLWMVTHNISRNILSYEWSDLCGHYVSWESGNKLAYELCVILQFLITSFLFLRIVNLSVANCLGKACYWRSYFWSETVEFLWTLLEDNCFWGHTTVGFDKITWKSYFWLSHSLPSERKWHKKEPKFQFSILPANWLHESPLSPEMEL
jgi:hypothetical protein